MWISKNKYKAMKEKIRQLEEDKKELKAFQNATESSFKMDSNEITKIVFGTIHDASLANKIDSRERRKQECQLKK